MKSFKRNKSPLTNYQFHIDTVSPELIAGWAVEKDNNEATPTIEVRSGETLLWSSLANIAREDLKEAGLGDSAFMIFPNLMSISDNIEQIDLYIDGHKVNSEPYDFVVQAPDVAQYQCFIDHVGETNLSGWAQYQAAPEHKPLVSIYSDDLFLGEGRAEQLRQDLLDANIGDGHYAFDISLNLQGLKAGVNLCQVYLDGHLANLPPLEITVSEQSLKQAALFNLIGNEIGSFNQLMSRATEQLHQQIEAHSQGQPTTLNIVANVAINNIAQLSARMQVIEASIAKLIEKNS